MSAPEPIDEFDRLLANEDKLEKYVSLGLALEELLEKLRAKGFEAEKETLSRLLELSPARAQLLELAAERLLDTQKRQDEQAFLRDHKFVDQPALQNLNLTPEQKKQLQYCIEWLHQKYRDIKGKYMKPPSTGSLVSMDSVWS